MVHVLHDLTKGKSKIDKKSPVDWNDEARDIFEILKQAIVDAPMLHFLQKDGKVTLILMRLLMLVVAIWFKKFKAKSKL